MISISEARHGLDLLLSQWIDSLRKYDNKPQIQTSEILFSPLTHFNQREELE
jgi:hypothetical protein